MNERQRFCAPSQTQVNDSLRDGGVETSFGW
jgi:hypothetical protein